MEAEIVEQIILNHIENEFPKLSFETVSEIMEVVGNGWEFKESNIQYMKKYIDNRITTHSRNEFINKDLDLYHKACECYPNDNNMVMDKYCSDLMNKYECVCWIGETHNPQNKIEEIYVWCD